MPTLLLVKSTMTCSLVNIIDACGSDNLLQKRAGLIEQGLNYSSIVATMWKRGDVFVFVFPKAQEFHDNIYSKLRSLNDPV